MQRVATRFADCALMPFALGVGCALYVPTSRAFGGGVGTGTAVAGTLCALTLWYGLGIWLRTGTDNSGETPVKSVMTPLHTRIDQMLTEARVILPGAQAFLGFQLIVMMTPAFDELAPSVRSIHLTALACVLSAVLLLIAPAAVHRIAFAGRDDERLYAVGGTLLTWALAPFALGICCDLYVAMTRLVESEWLARTYAGVTLAFLVSLWYLVPLALRRARRAER